MVSRERSMCRKPRPAILLAGLAIFSVALGRGPHEPAPVPPFSESNRLPGLSGDLSSRGACDSNDDCDDNNACTNDFCSQQGACVHNPRPNCVPCDPGYFCPEMDVVFVVDTSGSMRDEATALCNETEAFFADLALRGVNARYFIYGITEAPGGAFSCLTDTVVNLFGSEVPGFDPCNFPNDPSSFESWGSATAIVAQNFPWRDDAFRFIVPLADEGPCNGSRPDGCNDPGDDRDSIDNASFIASDFIVGVSPIIGTGADGCVTGLADSIASFTGGIALTLKDPKVDLKPTIEQALTLYCTPNPTPACNDRNTCTSNDTCRSGVCTGEVNYDPFVECCSPTTGQTVPVDDNNPCTQDLCNVQTGEVNHPPAEPGTPCDDGDACTADDSCVEGGGCAGTDINGMPCADSSECFGAWCDPDADACFCTDTPTLRVNVVADPELGEGCHRAGEELVVNVELGFSTQRVAAGNLLIGYDPTVLDFIDIIPGSEASPPSDFSVELFQQVNEGAGRVAYGVAVPINHEGVNGPAIMASLRFKALTACSDDEVCLLKGNPLTTKLSDAAGAAITFLSECSGPIKIDGTPPQFNCPASTSMNSAPGQVTARVFWPTVGATSQCDGTLPRTCTATHSLGANVNSLLNAGGVFPAGTSSFSCKATDACGAETVCAWSVEVRTQNPVAVDIQLSPTLSRNPADQPLTRCIEFEFYSNCIEQPEVVQQSVDFGLPYNLTGFAKGVEIKAPAGQYACATARDPLHSLRSVSSLQVIDGRFFARFEGDPFFNGNWLVAGNLDGNSVIDVVDFGVFIEQFLTLRGKSTPCGTPGHHADINGDGIVDALDLSFISLNFLKSDKGSCCPGAVASEARPGRTSVPVEELRRLDLSQADRMDVNRDGSFDMSDVAAFLRGELSRKPAGGDRDAAR